MRGAAAFPLAVKARMRTFPLAWIGRHLVVLGVLLVSIHMWSWQGIDSEMWKKLNNVVLLVLPVLLFRKGTPLRTRSRPYELYALVLFLGNYAVQVPAGLFHGQDVVQGMYGLKLYAFWLLYWYLHSRDYPASMLWKYVVGIGAVWSLITIGQQFLAVPMFYSRFDSEAETPFEVRSGLSRFMIEGMAFGLLALFRSVQMALVDPAIKRRLFWIALILLQFGGVVFYATRQVLVVSLLCVLVQVVVGRRGQAWRTGTVVALSSLAVLAVPLALSSLGDVVSTTKGDLTTDNVRIRSAEYFVMEHWPHPLAWLVGNGRSVPGSEYAMELARLEHSKGLFQIDIGILGDFSQFGLVYCGIMLAAILLGVGYLRRPASSALGAMFLYMLISLPLVSLFTNITMVPFCAALLYLADRATMEAAA